MDVPAKVTSKGQVTIPKPVREALGLSQGDEVVFRIDGARVELVRTPNLLELAGAVDVPARRRGVSHDAARRQAWSAQAKAGR